MIASREADFSSGAKNFAVALVAVSGATLILRIVLRSAETESVLGAISYLSQGSVRQGGVNSQMA